MFPDHRTSSIVIALDKKGNLRTMNFCFDPPNVIFYIFLVIVTELIVLIILAQGCLALYGL